LRRLLVRCTVVPGCGDGVVFGGEECDDGNADSCDGCSAACRSEAGLRCGDGVVNADCGEECDPPEAGICTSRCARVARCGDGVLDPGETCDDGNANDCDACTSACTPVTGCGDGVVCGTEACDDGGGASCDGCSATCTVEVGAACGDGIVNATCGEECDPPGTLPECSWLCHLGPAPPLGTRHLSFGGSLYSSALGTGIPLGPLEGAFDVVAGAPTPDGVASLTVTGPIHVRAAILGGTFGYMCVRIGSCTGIVDCTGGTPVGAGTVKDSAGPGRQDNPTVVTTGLGGDGGPGAVLLTCAQAVVQVPAGGDSDCSAHVYPPDETVAYTTGQGEGHFVNGDSRVGSGEIALSGERFGCTFWTAEDGSGKLAGVFLMEADPIVGDTANVCLIDD
jgi:cysteine-rich repeat protein